MRKCFIAAFAAALITTGAIAPVGTALAAKPKKKAVKVQPAPIPPIPLAGICILGSVIFGLITGNMGGGAALGEACKALQPA